MRTYRFTVEVTADEADRLLDTENLRIALGDAADSQLTVTSVRIDGREYDPATYTLEETPINSDIAQEIALGHTIQAIKMLRENNEGMSLMEAKKLIDDWREKR